MTPEHAQAAAAQAKRTRDIEFLSLMVHDLRQPLSVVLGFAITLEDRWADLPDARKREYVGQISKSAAWMQSLVDDIVTTGESVAGSMKFTSVPFSVPALIEETIRVLDPAVRFRLMLDIDDDLPLAFGDVVKQHKVLQNLLDNAVKYSGPETPIRVGLTERNGMLVMTIADRGIGIPPKDLETVFDKYARVTDDEHVASIKGSGLGLYVCSAIVEAQGGEIGVESNTHGVGSVFTYTLPMAP